MFGELAFGLMLYAILDWFWPVPEDMPGVGDMRFNSDIFYPTPSEILGKF